MQVYIAISYNEWEFKAKIFPTRDEAKKWIEENHTAISISKILKNEINFVTEDKV